MVPDTDKLTSFIKSAFVEDAPAEEIGPMPIPDTKPELLEFFSTLRPQMRKSEFLVDVYEEAVVKAQRFFPGDPDLQRYVADSEERIKEIRQELKEKKEQNEVKANDKIIAVIFLILLAFLVMGLLIALAM